MTIFPNMIYWTIVSKYVFHWFIFRHQGVRMVSESSEVQRDLRQKHPADEMPIVVVERGEQHPWVARSTAW